MKRTVIYMGGFRLPDKNAAAHRVMANAKLLRDIGYRVVFVDTQSGPGVETDVLASRHEVEGFETFSLRYPTTGRAWVKRLTSVNAFEQVSAQYANVALVICYNFPAVALSRLHARCRRRGVKILADVTEWYGKGEAGPRDAIRRADSSLRMRLIHWKMDGLIVISKYLEAYYRHHPHVIRLPPLVDLEELKWRNSQTGRRPREEMSFIYSGSPGARKDNLRAVVKAFQELRTNRALHLNIVGVTLEEYTSNFNRSFNSVATESQRIIFHGFLEHERSIEVLKSADYSIFIRDESRSNKAGFPTKYVESVSAGVPVVTNQMGDLDGELIRWNGGKMVDGTCSEAIMDALEEILRGAQHRASRAHPSQPARLYDYRNYKHEVQAFFEEVLS